jgi:hypothetical protein
VFFSQTSRGTDTEKFTSFVDEVKMVEREQPMKPHDYSKVKFEKMNAQN